MKRTLVAIAGALLVAILGTQQKTGIAQSEERLEEIIAVEGCANELADDYKAAIEAHEAVCKTQIQSGIEMLYLLNVIRQRYLDGLTERALISYFTEADNGKKFEKYWQTVGEQWWGPRVPPCTAFASWDQLAEDRVWAKLAGMVLAGKDGAGLSDEAKGEIFGASWGEMQNLEKGEALYAPMEPRRINSEAMERYKTEFPVLFEQYRLDAELDTFAKLRHAIRKETLDKLIHPPTGMRKKIYREYRNEALQELEGVTEREGTMVRFVIIEVPDGYLPGFSVDELRLISPAPKQSLLALTASGRTVEVGEVTIDRGASVGETDAWSFVWHPEEENELRLYLEGEPIQRVLDKVDRASDDLEERRRSLVETIDEMDEFQRKELAETRKKIEELAQEYAELTER